MHDALKRYIEATNTWDFEQVAKCLRPEAVYFFTDKTCVGLQEIRDYFEAGWRACREESYWPTRIKILHEDADSMLCTYQYNYTGVADSGPISGFGRATNHFVRNAITGVWELSHEHLSPPARS